MDTVARLEGRVFRIVTPPELSSDEMEIWTTAVKVSVDAYVRLRRKGVAMDAALTILPTCVSFDTRI